MGVWATARRCCLIDVSCAASPTHKTSNDGDAFVGVCACSCPLCAAARCWVVVCCCYVSCVVSCLVWCCLASVCLCVEEVVGDGELASCSQALLTFRHGVVCVTCRPPARPPATFACLQCGLFDMSQACACAVCICVVVGADQHALTRTTANDDKKRRPIDEDADQQQLRVSKVATVLVVARRTTQTRAARRACNKDERINVARKQC